MTSSFKRVLLVDDDAAAAGTAHFIRGHFESVVVILVQNGVEALRLMMSEQFDAIVLDGMMPLKTGPEVFTEFMAANVDANRVTPVCFYSANGLEEDLMDPVLGWLEVQRVTYIQKGTTESIQLLKAWFNRCHFRRSASAGQIRAVG